MLQNLEMTSYRRDHVARVEEAPVVSRGLVLCMLLLLVCGQALWAVKRYSPAAASPAALAEAPLSVAPTTDRAQATDTALALSSTRASSRKTARLQGALASAPGESRATRATTSAPVRRPLRATDICLALSGALPQASLTIDADRRAQFVETITQMQKAGEQGKLALDQARAALSEDQIKEMLSLIGQEPYASMQGSDLEGRSRDVMVKIAEGTEAPAPTTIGRPLPEAVSLTIDQILRGALALENTSVMLSRSQAAQIEAARSDLETARKRQQLWRKQLLGLLTPDERAQLSSHLQPINGAEDARAVKEALAALHAAE